MDLAGIHEKAEKKGRIAIDQNLQEEVFFHDEAPSLVAQSMFFLVH